MRRATFTGKIATACLAAAALATTAAAQSGAAPGTGRAIGPIAKVSWGPACAGQNAEVEQAAVPAQHVIYEEWIGCGGIGFSKSTDGGRHFSRGIELPKSGKGWDPALAVGPTGIVYAAFMVNRNGKTYPVVDISTDQGKTFPTVSQLGSPVKNNWGDRVFIAIGPTGTIYVTWDYGPSAAEIKYVCTAHGSCSFTAGDLNSVLQRSTNGGATWSKIIPISPGFPASGADSAPVLVEPGGRLAALYQGYRVLSRKTLKLGLARNYFTTSADGGNTWSRPVRVGPAYPAMNTTEWWIDGSLGRDSGGTLYATWDTQTGGQDIGWIDYSADGGRTWAAPRRVTPDRGNAVHIVQVAGGAPGRAYVGWLADNSPAGYALYLRSFSAARGWLSGPIQVSSRFGSRLVWPGDTIGVSLYGAAGPGHAQVALSWGSAVGGSGTSEIYGTVATFP